MFVCPVCYHEVYVDDDLDIIECSGCDYSVGLEAVYIDDSIINF